MTEETFRIIFFLIAACIGITIFVRKFFGPLKKSKSVGEFSRLILEADRRKFTEAQIQFGTKRKTLVVDVFNCISLVVFGEILLQWPTVGWLIAGYVFIGIMLNYSFGAKDKAALKGLAFPRRLWLGLFHAWWWPFYYLFNRKS